MSFSSWARSRLDLWRRYPYLTIRFILFVWCVWYVFNGIYKRLAVVERTTLPPKCLPDPCKLRLPGQASCPPPAIHDDESSYRGVGSLHFDGTKWLCACKKPNSWSGETCEFDIQADKERRRAAHKRELQEAKEKLKAKYPDL